MVLFYLSLLDTAEDKQKFEKIYYEYRELMRCISLGILQNNESAEDAVHDAFVKLTRYLDGIDDVCSPKTEAFIIKVIRSVSIDNLRKEKRHLILNINELGELKDNNKDILENINAKELMLKLKSLPDIYRDVLELRVYHELTIKQIAYILNVSPSSARKRLERARKHLLKLLEE